MLRDGKGIRISNLPKSGIQRLPINALERHKDHVTVTADEIVFSTVDGDVAFLIVREPGRFCLTCGERLPDHGGNGTLVEAQRAAQCREHVKGHGKTAEKPDDWPHGYVNRPNTFECTIEDRRHG
jgi:hypothetical protein